MSFLKKNYIYLVLHIFTILIILTYLFIGLTSKTIDYFLPKRALIVLAVIVVSYALAFSSKVFQSITNNKLLTPQVMGYDSLYILFQTLIAFIVGSTVQIARIADFFVAISLMVLFSLLLNSIFNRLLSKKIYVLLLIGTILSQVFKSITNFIQVIMDPNEFSHLEGKLIPSFNNINTNLVLISATIIGLLAIISAFDYKKYDVLQLGYETSVNLGINHRCFTFKSQIIISVLVSVATALVGPLSFVGILVVSVTNMLLKTYKHKYHIWFSTLLTMAVLMLSLLIVNYFLKSSTSVNVILNLIGGLGFLILLLRQARGGK